MALERPDWEWYERASDLVAAGRFAEADEVVEAALAAGHLWRISMLIAPKLEPLWGRERFEKAAAEARRRVEARGFQPVVLSATPSGIQGVAPLVLSLHGATGNAREELERWRPATELGWIVAAGQSSQPATEDGFCWDPPRERIWQDLRAIVASLPPHARVVLAGFSQGAWVALNAALRADLVQAASVVMVGPFPGPTANLEPAWRRLRISVLVGSEDVLLAEVRRLVGDLQKRHHHVALEVIPGLGHAYPPDFAARLPGLLKP